MKSILLLAALCSVSLGGNYDNFPTYTQPKVVYRSDLGPVLNNTEYAENFLLDCPNDSIKKHPNIKCNPKYPYRLVNGLCNNLEHVWYGASKTPFSRISNPQYDDGYQSPRRFSAEEGRFLPSARDVSRAISVEQKTTNLSNFFTGFGQFVAHDTVQARSSGAECGACDNRNPDCFNIMVKDDDKFLNSRDCLPFTRNADQFVDFNCPSEFRNQVSRVTHFLDMGTTYGSSEEQETPVRLFEDGFLKFSEIPGSKMEGLPIVDITQCPMQRGCFIAGDTRAEQNPALTIMHTLFIRNHNLMAREYRLNHPNANDEEIYQEVRRINNAIYQHIIYNEYLPLIIGKNLLRAYNLSPLKSGFLYDYDSKLLPNLPTEYQASAGRLHNIVHENLATASDDLVEIGTIHLTNVLFEINQVYDGFDLYSQGLLIGKSNSPTTSQFSNSLNNRFFSSSLSAINIQRGRDEGNPSYNHYRSMFGLKFAETFDDLSDFIGPESIEAMKKVYVNVNDVDLFFGGISELPIPGGLVGPTNANIIAHAFHNLKFGDRFYYENGNDENLRFTLAQLDNIRHISLASIVCQNLGLNQTQEYIFQLTDKYTNPIVNCNQLPRINIALYGTY